MAEAAAEFDDLLTELYAQTALVDEEIRLLPGVANAEARAEARVRRRELLKDIASVSRAREKLAPAVDLCSE